MKAKKKYQEGGLFPFGKLAKEKKRARKIREGYSPSEGNETHLMGLWEGSSKYGEKGYTVAPTVRPIMEKTIDRKGIYMPQSLDEAIENNETFEFKNKRTAERFSYGSWKKGRDRKEAMKAYMRDKKNSKK